MNQVDFVVTNPGHHWSNALAVARELDRAGTTCRIVSLCELRGFETPPPPPSSGVEVVSVVDLPVRRAPSWGSGGGGRPSRKRLWARRIVWSAFIKRGLLRALRRRPSIVVLPNDAAYPYDLIAALLRRLGLRYILLQEGIRFPLPNELSAPTYGLGGADAIACWGPSSVEHFRGLGVPENTLFSTGCPRFDGLRKRVSSQARAGVRASLGLESSPLVFLSNPIDDQGFCSHGEKLELIGRFLSEIDPLVGERRLDVVLKLHARENVEEFRELLEDLPSRERYRVTRDTAVHPLLVEAAAAIVLASTVGLEALMLEVPLGVLELPGHGCVFDYVDSGAATALSWSRPLPEQLRVLLDDGATTLSASAGYLSTHLANRERAASCVTSLIDRIAHDGSR